MTAIAHHATQGPQKSAKPTVVLTTYGWTHLPGTRWELLLKGKGLNTLTIVWDLTCKCTVPMHVRGEPECRYAGDPFEGWRFPLAGVWARERR